MEKKIAEAPWDVLSCLMGSFTERRMKAQVQCQKEITSLLVPLFTVMSTDQSFGFIKDDTYSCALICP